MRSPQRGIGKGCEEHVFKTGQWSNNERVSNTMYYIHYTYVSIASNIDSIDTIHSHEYICGHRQIQEGRGETRRSNLREGRGGV